LKLQKNYYSSILKEMLDEENQLFKVLEEQR